MVVKLLLILALVSTALVHADEYSIKLENFENPDFSFINEKTINTTRYFSEPEQKKKKFRLDSFETNLGPLKTRLKYNPFNQRAQFETNMDLIESYEYFKQNHDPRRLLPYAMKGVRQNASNLKHIRSKVKNRSLKLYQDFKDEVNSSS